MPEQTPVAELKLPVAESPPRKPRLRCVRIHEDILDLCREAAAEDGRTLSKTIDLVLRTYFEERKQYEAAAKHAAAKMQTKKGPNADDRKFSGDAQDEGRGAPKRTGKSADGHLRPK
jgi:hypothetical protein